MIALVDGWVPVRHRDTVRELAREIDAAIGGFLRGQLAVCLVLGAYYAIALMLVGLNFGLLIGLIAGLITFVPYIGSLTGLMIAASVAIAQFWPDWKRIVVVVAIFLVGQFVEGNIISPKFVGERVGLHPLWMIFAMFAFGYLFGFVGLLLAVPLAAAIGGAVPFRAAAISCEPALLRERSPALMRGARVNLRSALDHAESLAREDFLGGPSNAAALALIDTLARLARTRRSCSPARRAPARATSRRYGRRRRARAASRRARCMTPRCRRRSPPARWWSRTSPPALRRAGALSPAQPRARGRGLLLLTARTRRRMAVRHPRPRLPPQGAAGRRTRAAGRCAAARGAGEAVRRPPTRGRRKPDRLCGDADRAFLSPPRAARWPRSTRRRMRQKRPMTRALGGEFLRCIREPAT